MPIPENRYGYNHSRIVSFSQAKIGKFVVDSQQKTPNSQRIRSHYYSSTK